MNGKLDLASVGARIKALREHRELSQGQLAELVGGHTSKISAWENGERLPETAALHGLSCLFGVTTDYLLTGQHHAPAFVAASLRELLERLEEGTDAEGGMPNAPHLNVAEGEELHDAAEERPARAARRAGAAGAAGRRSR